jgi:branched-chain amino acid transport system permease protein
MVYFPLVILGLLLALPLLIRNPFYQDILVMTFLFGTLACAWNITGGFAGLVSVGHTAFFGFGAYTSTILYMDLGISPWVGIFAGAGIAILAAVVIGYPCFRLKSHFFAIATICIAEVFRRIAGFWTGMTGGGKGLLIPIKLSFLDMQFADKPPFVYLCLFMMLLVIYICYVIRNTKIGFNLISLRDDQDAAESLGINTSLYKLIALVISVFFTAAAGTIYAQYLMFVDPHSTFSLSLSIQLILLCVIGGLGTIIGPVLGSFILTPLDPLLRGWFGSVAGLNFIIYGIVLIIAVLYLPEGLVKFFRPVYYSIIERLPGSRQSRGCGEEDEPSDQTSILFPTAVSQSKVPDRIDGRYAEETILEVKGLCKHFKGLVAIDSLDFCVKKGEIVGLIGPNGAGKTTCFNLITGFLRPDSGTIRFLEEYITALKPHQVCSKAIVRTFQIVKPFGKMTVLENVMVGGFSRTNDRKVVEDEAKKIINFIGLEKYLNSLASNLTIADRKRLELGRTLATKPELLLLDECMAGLNPTETEEMIRLVKKIRDRGITLVIIEHVMKAIMHLSDRIIVLHHGEKIAEGPPEQVAKDEKVIEAYLGEEFSA